MAATTLEERVSRLEGAYEHLATKADLYRVALTVVIANAAVNGAFLAAIRWLG